MNYQEFKMEIENSIKNYLPEQYQSAAIAIREITKNNNSVYSALSFTPIGDGIARQLYLEGAYEEYCNTSNMEDILKKTAQFIVKSLAETVVFNHAMVTDFEQAKDQIVLKLVNRDSNQEQLKAIPYQELNNTGLVATFRIDVSLGNEDGSILVNNEMLKAWGVEKDDLYEMALNNTQEKYPFTLQSMEDIINKMIFDTPAIVTPNQLPAQLGGQVQYVLSNEKSLNGATCLLYPDLLKEIGTAFDSNFFILPSSIHELILLKDTGEVNACELQRMVIDVNTTSISPEELLSHHVYSYDHKENTLSMGTTVEETKALLESLSNNCDVDNCIENQEEMERE